MADTLAATLKAGCAWLYQETLDLGAVADASKLEYAAALADGTGTDQADKIWHDERSVAAGTNDDLDLTALSQTLFGATVTTNLVKVKAVLVVCLSTTSGDKLRVGGAGTNAFAAPFAGDANAAVEVGADGALLLTNKKSGWSVTPGTGDILRIRNPGAAAVSYRIVILGTSA